MAVNLACSHAQSQALDAPFMYLENIGEIEPDSNGRRMEAQEVLPCTETMVETWTEAGDYLSQKRFHSEAQDLLRYDWIVTHSAEGGEELREEVNGQPPQQDWNDYGSGQEYSLSLYTLAEAAVDLPDPDANCLPETASTAFCFLTKD